MNSRSLIILQCYHCFKHYDYEIQQANERYEDLERRNRELEQKLSSMEHQKMAEEEEASGQHEEVQGGNGEGETEIKGDANLPKGTLLKLFKPKKKSPEKI